MKSYTRDTSNANDHHVGNEDFCEIARIFAVGILRLHARSVLPAEHDSDAKNSPESGQDCLEVSDDTVLSVHLGKRVPRLRERNEHVD